MIQIGICVRLGQSHCLAIRSRPAPSKPKNIPESGLASPELERVIRAGRGLRGRSFQNAKKNKGVLKNEIA